jgi:hypothetical protein
MAGMSALGAPTWPESITTPDAMIAERTAASPAGPTSPFGCRLVSDAHPRYRP